MSSLFLANAHDGWAIIHPLSPPLPLGEELTQSVRAASGSLGVAPGMGLQEPDGFGVLVTQAGSHAEGLGIEVPGCSFSS